MRKILFLGLILFFLFKAEAVSADSNVVSTSAFLKSADRVESEYFDPREVKLKKYLESHKSPLAPYAGSFIKYADIYELDYRLVPAISGVESTFGKRIPYKSFNAYGWANGEYRFKSWDESIMIVSRTLREKYYDRGADDITKIARRYAPPSTTWGRNIKFFMKKIDPTPVEFDL